jgi:hypothetical protein
MTTQRTIRPLKNLKSGPKTRVRLPRAPRLGWGSRPRPQNPSPPRPLPPRPQCTHQLEAPDLSWSPGTERFRHTRIPQPPHDENPIGGAHAHAPIPARRTVTDPPPPLPFASQREAESSGSRDTACLCRSSSPARDASRAHHCSGCRGDWCALQELTQHASLRNFGGGGGATDLR